MSGINFHTKEISVKIVYYGPGLCGKTTTLQTVYGSLPEKRRQRFVSLATEVDRTIFFDFLPVTAYRIREFDVRLQLYTVPGQVFYNATRKLVLNGVDGLVFVADSQRAMRDSNLESLQNLKENLQDLGMDVNEIPLVVQANKRDLSDIDSLEEIGRLYNPMEAPLFGTVATKGQGVFEALKTISQLVVNNLIRKGLGAQIAAEGRRASTAQENSPRPELDKTAQPAEGIASTLASMHGPQTSAQASAPSESTQAAAPDTAATLGRFLWPDGHLGELGAAINYSLAHERWADALLAVEALLKYQSERWAASASYNQGEPLPAFLLLRGVNGARYHALAQAVALARQGDQARPIERSDAMSATILALQAVW